MPQWAAKSGANRLNAKYHYPVKEDQSWISQAGLDLFQAKIVKHIDQIEQ